MKRYILIRCLSRIYRGILLRRISSCSVFNPRDVLLNVLTGDKVGAERIIIIWRKVAVGALPEIV